MNNEIQITLSTTQLEQLTAFGEILSKDAQTMVDEALAQYFEMKEEEIARQDPMTNLSYDEFWDDLEF